MQVFSNALGTFCHHKFTKIDQDNLNERDDYDEPLSEQQYTHGSCYISLFKYKYFGQSDPPPLNRLKF